MTIHTTMSDSDPKSMLVHSSRWQLARRSLSLLLFACLLCTSVHSCGSANRDYIEALDNEPTTPLRSDELAATDQVEIRVVGHEDLSGTFTVSSHGSIVFPIVGEMDVAGSSCDEVSERIATTLTDAEYLIEPTVICQIATNNSRKIDVIGEVNNPGSYDYQANMTILRVIAMSEGFTADAAPNETAVLRVLEGVETRIGVPVDDIIAGEAPNFPLRPGDIVVVPRYQLLP